jgi:hypothetical protein
MRNNRKRPAWYDSVRHDVIFPIDATAPSR